MLGCVMAMFKHMCTCMCACVHVCACVRVCVCLCVLCLHMCVGVYMHMRKPEEDTWCPAFSLYLIPLRWGPSMNLELGWWPESPSEPPVPAPHRAGLQVCM